MDTVKKKDRVRECLFFTISFIFLMIFFTSIHPLIVYDSDDWLYMSYRREAIPDIREWNPSKVLPETLMPIVSDFGAHVIRLFVGDYIQSLTLAYAFIGALFILAFVGIVYKAIDTYFSLDKTNSLLVTLFFFFLCFSIYRNDWSQNYYMFWARNVNCFFNYIIPGMLNSGLVVYLLIRALRKNERSYSELGILLLLTYLAVYSNLFHSCILATFVGVKLLYSIKELKDGVKAFTSKYIYELITLALWLVSLAFEGTGARASESSGFTMQRVMEVTVGLVKKTIHMNKVSLVLVMIINIVAIVLLKYRNDKKVIDCYNAMYRIAISSAVLLTVFLILLCAAVDPTYVERTDAIFGFSFWILFITSMSLGLILSVSGKIMIVLPLVSYLFICNVLNSGRMYKNSNEMGMFYTKCIAIDNYIIDQAIEADQNGLDKTTIKVPVGVNSVNWPHATNMGGRLANTLYQHGVISRYMEITIEPDENVNEMFHLDY